MTAASRFGSFAFSQPVRLRLFCFPHAGGGAALYYTWRRDLPAEIGVCPIHLPGRENRIDDAPFADLPTLIAALADALLPALDLPFSFFGHSMGSLVGFELARELRRRSAPLPVHLFVAARRAPQVPETAAPMHVLADPEFVAEVCRRYNGIPAAVLADPELMRLFLPSLRADVKLLETHVYRPEPPLPCAISAFAATEDRVVGQEGVAAWREHASGRFTLRVIEGEHFFLTSARSLVLSAVAEDLRPYLGRERP